MAGQPAIFIFSMAYFLFYEADLDKKIFPLCETQSPQL
jgi:hypothetical protein